MISDVIPPVGADLFTTRDQWGPRKIWASDPVSASLPAPVTMTFICLCSPLGRDEGEVA